MKLLKIDVDLYSLKCTDEELEELEQYIDDNDLVEQDVELVEVEGELSMKRAMKLLKEYE
jgi:ribosomal protein S13